MRNLLLFFFLIFLGGAPCINGEELTGDEIIRRADKVMVGDTATFSNHMVVKRPGLEDVIARYQTSFMGRGEKVMLRMIYPPKQSGKDLLLIGDNMWQYVPNIERSVRVAGKQRFMGGDFNNADLLKVSLVRDYSGKLIRKDKIKKRTYYFLELIKKRPQATYDKVHYWVDVATFIPFREVYYTRSGKKMKTLQFLNVGKVDDRKVPRTLVMINALRPDHKTIINILKGEYNLNLNKSEFTRTYLERKRN